MNKRFIVLFGMIISIFSLYAEEDRFLLDDFNDGNDRNRLGLYWFYYSDVNDSGNSQIHNADYLGNGAYSRVKTVQAPEKEEENMCAFMEFTIGKKIGDPPPFVGIGTDISLTNKGIDISQYLSSKSLFNFYKPQRY